MKQCITCGAPLWKAPLLTLDNMPASAQHMSDAQGVEEDQGPTLDLCQCMGCGLVQFDCEPANYYRGVIQTGSFSKTMVEPRRYQYKHLVDSHHLEGKKFTEARYSQGGLLEVLSEFPVEVRGMEHDPHLMELAGAQGLDVTEGFTETRGTRFAGELHDAFLSFSFLEHRPSPSAMLQAIYRNLEDDAMGFTTVPGFEYIMDHNSYYELIRDHLAYYTSETLTPLLECSGFQIEECEVISRDTLSVIVRERPQMDTKNLLECYVNLKREMETYMKYLDAWDKRVAIWGASHQGFVLAAATKLEERARYIIDSAPFEQKKFAPAPRLPIVGPDHFREYSVDTIVITAPDYADEVAANIRRKFRTAVEVRTMRSNHLEMVQEG